MCDEWRNDFWSFVRVIDSKPAGHTLRRSNESMPLSSDNWEWKESTPSKDKAAYQREWRNKNPTKSKGFELKRRFGITLDQYESMMSAQNGVCSICKQPENTKDKDGGPRGMPVDHCHTTGKVRGLLCTPCNRALGMFKDNTDTLRAAIEYLNKFTP
jgi:hypothetical protein